MHLLPELCCVYSGRVGLIPNRELEDWIARNATRPLEHNSDSHRC